MFTNPLHITRGPDRSAESHSEGKFARKLSAYLRTGVRQSELHWLLTEERGCSQSSRVASFRFNTRPTTTSAARKMTTSQLTFRAGSKYVGHSKFAV